MKDLHPALGAALAQPADPNAVPVDRQTPQEARAEFARDMKALDAPAPEVARVQDVETSDGGAALRVRIYDPAPGDARPRPVLLYVHGGGWIRGSIDTHDSACRILAAETPCMVVSAAYRLAPENRFPDAVHDAYAALEWVGANIAGFGGDPRRLAIGGDSAGGNIAAGVTILARERTGPRISFQLLIYPVTDLTSDTPSKRAFSKGYFLDFMPFYIASYLGPAGDAADPLASPLLHPDLSRLPPAFVITAGYDPLRDEGQAYAKRLGEAGVRADHDCFEDMIHGFVSCRGLVDEADAALRRCAGALRAGLG